MKKTNDKILVMCSGGKDSTATLLLALEQFNKKDIIPIFADTGFEHFETKAYLKYLQGKLGIDIRVVRSKKYNSVLDCIEYKKIFPGPTRRFCTFEMKLRPIEDYTIDNGLLNGINWIGIRKAESANRAARFENMISENRYGYTEINVKARKILKTVKVQYPVIDWTEKEVYKKITSSGLKVNKLYEMGHKRVGCYPCIISGLKDYRQCWKDKQGKRNITALMDLEEKLNKMGKATTIKPDYNRHKIRGIMRTQDDQLLFPYYDESPMCEYCNI